MVGADAESLERAALEMRSAADDLESHETWLTSSLNSVSWLGGVAAWFLDGWSGGHRVRIRSTADFIREQADLLQAQAADQRSTSESDGSGGAGGPGPSGPGGSPGETGERPDTVPADDVFSDEYMRDLAERDITGADDPALNEALEELFDDPDPERVDELLDEIAEIRGVDPDDLRASYEEYLSLRDQLGSPPTPVDLDEYPDFLGSTTSLRYGQAVGDALGIDPVFGALLNPTGGLVGPGNDLIGPFGAIEARPGSILANHGTFHDAAGFLYNNFGEGPGYAYIDGDTGDPGNPHSGQVEGIKYWTDVAKDNAVDGVQDWFADRGRDVVDGGRDVLEGGRDVLEGGRDLLEKGWRKLT